MGIRKPTQRSASLSADQAIINARREMDRRASGYREQAMKMYPWICGRCAREFTHINRHELTVHHRDHDHDNNPSNGSNWELLCLYCHDNEHQRRLDATAVRADSTQDHATSNPFADLKARLKAAE